MKNNKMISIFVLIFTAAFVALIFIEFEAENPVSYYTDEKTGVEYIVFHNSITPRLDKTGKVMVKK